MSEQHGAIWWSELMTRDPAAAMAYYGQVCGWSWDEMPMPGGTYLVAMRDGQPVAGVMDMTGLEELKGVPAHWFTYIAVDDLDAAIADTVAAGGALAREPFEMADVGRIAILSDPTGAMVGLMTPAGSEIG